VNLRNQMREIARSIRLELGRIAETYKSEFEIATAREESVQKSLAQIVSESQTTNQAQIALRELESSAQTYRALYDNFLQRYMESVQQQSFPITEARVITQASRPGGKSSPKSTLVLALSIAGGMLLGIGLGVLRDISDRVFRTGRQVETLLQTDCIAVLPKLHTETKDIKTGRKPAPAPSGSRTIVRAQSLLWHVIDSPFSRFAEGVRSVKVATDVSAVTKSNRVIGITSALPNEGKSTVAAAFAQLMAHGGARVVLVDCDLRNPSLTRSLAPAATHGLLEVLEGVASLENVIWTDADTQLTFLPAVFKSRLPHTAEILSSEPMRKLFDSLRDRYDYVVVDLSPLSPVVDVRATTQLVDSFVFVIEWGRTSIDAVEHALSAARGVYESLLGVVLNKANMNVLGRYEAYRGNYYYNRYYSRYGYTE
jgi:succinoglycan biosynthesis transport protein ExoP